ncbi:TetR/AcrR family transcriptional regulator [Naasia sp. SYSU D00948]|uniref:TetR/AcrR family transcriptional regulator n=1 Tax=Naasia sp. SYSU D00948 TaxID=2817379 RepID=UPI001B30B91F|nr:TetR/AcrR family transcriptional regulator [Naasia sp. SYSU D00948]
MTVPSSALALQRIALEQFATAGFGGTSLGSIAQAAGLSKSSVLYHYESKEALLAAAVQPAVDALGALVAGYPGDGNPDEHDRFVERFIDYLFAHRLAVHLFMNQGRFLQHIEPVATADALLQRFAEAIADRIPGVEDRIRFGVALAGAAYSLVAAANWSSEELADTDDVRDALLRTVSSLLSSSQPAR